MEAKQKRLCQSPAACVQEIYDFSKLLNGKPNVYVEVLLRETSLVLTRGLLLEFQIQDGTLPGRIAIFRCRLSGKLLFRDPETGSFVSLEDEMVRTKINQFCGKLKHPIWSIRIDWQKEDVEIRDWERKFPLENSFFDIQFQDDNQKVIFKSSPWKQRQYVGGLSYRKPLELYHLQN